MVSSFACGKNSRSAQKVLDSICNRLTENNIQISPARNIYYYGAPSGTRSNLTERLAGLLYYGDREVSVPELQLLSDFAIRLPDDTSVFEIHIMKVKNLSDRDKIAELLERRLTLLKSRDIHLFVPDAYESNIASGRVVINGNFVVMLITPNNDIAEQGIL